jgi:hypothetical protein
VKEAVGQVTGEPQSDGTVALASSDVEARLRVSADDAGFFVASPISSAQGRSRSSRPPTASSIWPPSTSPRTSGLTGTRQNVRIVSVRDEADQARYVVECVLENRERGSTLAASAGVCEDRPRVKTLLKGTFRRMKSC